MTNSTLRGRVHLRSLGCYRCYLCNLCICTFRILAQPCYPKNMVRVFLR